MYNSRNVQKTFLYTIDKQNRVGYNTHRWSEQYVEMCKIMCSDTFIKPCTDHISCPRPFEIVFQISP